jgi:hypothetical protein
MSREASLRNQAVGLAGMLVDTSGSWTRNLTSQQGIRETHQTLAPVMALQARDKMPHRLLTGNDMKEEQRGRTDRRRLLREPDDVTGDGAVQGDLGTSRERRWQQEVPGLKGSEKRLEDSE